MIKYGRRGVGISAISAIDVALWDIIGKACGQPVCNLLGGRFRSRVRAYASSLYPYARLEDLAEEARIHVANGFDIVKMRVSNGPTEGLKGMKEDLAQVRTVREVIGDDVELAIEAAQGWNVEYALVMLKHLEPYNIKWIEEPVLADQIEGYRRIRQAANARGILISGGEHHFTRFEYWRLIKEGAVDILQPDVERVGGITEATKIWAMAQPEEIQVTPHQGYLHNLHLIISHFNSPLVEHHVPQWDPEGKSDVFRIIFDGEPAPERGYVSVPDTPGLGRTLSDWAKENVVER
jgi:L-alanine-DL-glutamate epimerase-like enolase superfamily enzyme